MANPAVRPTTQIDRLTPRGEFIVGTGRNIVPGSNAVPVLTVVVVDYAGKSRDDAAADVWSTWQTRYPGALIQVVHPDAGYEPLR